MNEVKYTLCGRVIRKESDEGIRGLRIEAWDNNMFFDVSLAYAHSDDLGNFKIDITEEQYVDRILESKPDLYFKVFLDNILLLTTCDQELWRTGEDMNNIVLQTNFDAGAEAELASNHIVKGFVRDSLNRGLEGLVVRVYDKEPRSEQLLGKVKTDCNGKYRLEYSRNHFNRADKKRADLTVKVYTGNGEDLLYHPLIENVRFNAFDREKIDVLISD